LNWNRFFRYALRSLIPAWRFFDQTEGVPVLYLRPADSPDCPWIRFDPHHRIRWHHLFHNPDGTSLHAFHNFLRLALRDPDDSAMQGLLRTVANRIGESLSPGHAEFKYRIQEERE
jgi:hypothetical protein